MVDHVPLDLHVGSMAVRRFIESRQPMLTLHGHIHESAWKGQKWSTTIKFMIDGLIYALVTAGTFGWLWPAATTG